MDPKSGTPVVVASVAGLFTRGIRADGGIAVIDDTRIVVWSPATGEPHVVQPGERFFAVSLSPDATRLGVALLEGVAIYSMGNGRRERTLPHPAARPIQYFDATGRFVRSDDPDDEIQHVVHTLAFSKDGLRLVSGGADATVRAWDLATGSEVARVEHHGPVRALALAEPYWISGSEDGTARVWDWDDRSDVRHRPIGRLSYIRPSMRVSPSESQVASAFIFRDPKKGFQARLTVQSLPQLERVAELVVDNIGAFAWQSAESLAIAVQSINGGSEIRLCSVPLNGPCRVQPLPAPAHALEFSADTKTLAVGLGDNQLAFWDLASGAFLVAAEKHQRNIVRIVPLDDGRMVTGSWDGTLKFWNTRSASVERTLEMPGGVFSFDISQDDMWLVAGSVSRGQGAEAAELRVWPLKGTGEPLRLQTPNTVFDVRFIADGTRFLAAQRDRLVIRQTADGAIESTLVGDFGTVAVSADARLFATSSLATGSVRIWDRASRAEIHRLTTAGSPMIFGSKSRFLLTSGQFGSPERHWLTLDDLQQELCQRISRSLTSDERATYLGSSTAACSCSAVPLWTTCDDPRGAIVDDAPVTQR